MGYGENDFMTQEEAVHALDDAFTHAYLIYQYRGKINVREGIVKMNRTFQPYDNPKRYHTKLHTLPLTLKYGKVWCRSAEDIERGIGIVKQARARYIADVEKRYEKLKGEVE